MHYRFFKKESNALPCFRFEICQYHTITKCFRKVMFSIVSVCLSTGPSPCNNRCSNLFKLAHLRTPPPRPQLLLHLLTLIHLETVPPGQTHPQKTWSLGELHGLAPQDLFKLFLTWRSLTCYLLHRTMVNVLIVY